jgi:hypothetical protein
MLRASSLRSAAQLAKRGTARLREARTLRAEIGRSRAALATERQLQCVEAALAAPGACAFTGQTCYNQMGKDCSPLMTCWSHCP